MSRTKISSVKKARKFNTLLNRDGNLCYFCCQQMTDAIPRRTRSTRTLDHIVPVQDGGVNHNSNLVLACDGCNNARGSMKFLEFIKTTREVTAEDCNRYYTAKLFRRNDATDS